MRVKIQIMLMKFLKELDKSLKIHKSFLIWSFHWSLEIVIDQQMKEEGYDQN